MAGKKKQARLEIRIVNPSKELFLALRKRALIENRSMANLAETLLNKEFKIGPKSIVAEG